MEKLIKIARSFSMKKNLGNFQTADFWMMQEIECKASEVEQKSEEVYQFIKSQVLKSYNEYGSPTPVYAKPNPETEYFEKIVKEWTCEMGHKVIGERCLNAEHYKDEKEQGEAVGYYQTKEGVKTKINKQENTLEPK